MCTKRGTPYILYVNFPIVGQERNLILSYIILFLSGTTQLLQ